MAAGGLRIGAAALSDFRKRLGEATKARDEGARIGLLRAAIHVRDVANTQVPLEEGDLARDGTPSVADGELKAAVSYGLDPEVAQYAVVQHEDMSLKHDAGRNAKFLENALNSERDATLETVRQAIRESMGT